MKKQNFLKGSMILMISAVVAKVLGAMFKIPLTNMLGGVGMSYFSCAYSLFMPFYALIVTGITSAVAKLVASSAALGMYSNALRIRRVALVLFSVAGVPASLLLAEGTEGYAPDHQRRLHGMYAHHAGGRAPPRRGYPQPAPHLARRR